MLLTGFKARYFAKWKRARYKYLLRDSVTRMGKKCMSMFEGAMGQDGDAIRKVL